MSASFAGAAHAPAPWLPAVARASLPQRWLACAAGVLVSGVIAWLVADLFWGAPAPLADWWDGTAEQGRRLLAEVAGAGKVRALVGGVLLVNLLAAVWAAVGGFVARDELLPRVPAVRASDPRPTPLGFLARRGGRLGVLMLTPCSLAGLLLMVPALAAALLLIPGGSLLVAAFLPLVWLAALALALVVAGASSFVLQPAAIAAEGSDQWDAIARGYNYFFQRPLLFLALEGAAALVAALPLALLHLGLDGDRTALGAAGPWVLLLATGFALSLFFSLQAPAYLELRRRVDGVPADEIYVETDAPAPERTARAPRPPATALPATPAGRGPFAELRACLVYLGLIALSWLVLAHT